MFHEQREKIGKKRMDREALEKRKKIASRNMAIKNLNDSMDKAEEETPVSAVKS